MSKVSTRRFVFLLGVVVVGALILVAGLANGWFESDELSSVGSNTVSQSNENPVHGNASAHHSDENARPNPRELNNAARTGPVESTGKKAESRDLPRTKSRVGASQPVSKTKNASTRSVAQALETGRFNERLSALQKPPPFDREEYLKDPQKYLDTIEPGRIYQMAKAGPGVTPIRRLNKHYAKILQGEKVVLRVEIEKGMPVTFHSGALGRFSNDLTTITVKASEEGIAEAVFLASSGTYGHVDIWAASPVHSHQAHFLVDVRLPNDEADK